MNKEVKHNPMEQKRTKAVIEAEIKNVCLDIIVDCDEQIRNLKIQAQPSIGLFDPNTLKIIALRKELDEIS